MGIGVKPAAPVPRQNAQGSPTSETPLPWQLEQEEAACSLPSPPVPPQKWHFPLPSQLWQSRPAMEVPTPLQKLQRPDPAQLVHGDRSTGLIISKLEW